MSLNDLNQGLYDPNSADVANRKHEQSEYDPTISVGQKISPFEMDQQWNQGGKGFSPEQKKKIWIGLSILLLISLVIGGVIFYRWWLKNAFHQDRVSISFEGPKEADSIQNVKYIIHYKNDNRVTLKNAEIQLSYSENFQPIDNLNLKYLNASASRMFIGDIKPMSSGQIELKGAFYAPKDSPVYLKGEIHFVPSNGTAELSMDNQIGVNITTAPVVVNVIAPQQIVDGDSLEYSIDYKNLDTRSIANVQIRVDFPVGFEISSSQPKASEKDSYWYIGDLDANQGGKINIKGKINGATNEAKNINVLLGKVDGENKFVVYNKQEFTSRVVSPVLAISQKIDGKNDNVVSAGEALHYTISYQNNGTIGMRDAIITAEIDGRVLDFSAINVENGFYDGARNMMIWKASDVPGLANINPGSGGSVRFSIPVKSVIPVVSRLDKNFIISSTAKIDSPDIPTPIDANKIIGSNRLELKVASKVFFDTTGYYADTKIKNTGPIPMRVGAETTFTMHWQVRTVSNDITGASVSSSLPSGMRWTGQIYPSGEKISYNARTNQLIWDIGDVPAATGVIGEPREVMFQVGVTPQLNQVGSPIALINKSIFTARDTFVGEEVNLTGDSKNTILPEDSSVGYMNGKVVN